MAGRIGRAAGGQRADGDQAASDRGALSLMLVVLVVGLVLLAGFVVDGGAQLAADENAQALAQEAARAGATSVDASTAYRNGSFVVDPALAASAASGYLADAGYSDYKVFVVSDREIRVKVTISEPTKFLSVIGINYVTSTGWATASLVTGVTGGT
jgi:Flp pilus assembly protein TadG